VNREMMGAKEHRDGGDKVFKVMGISMASRV
jgi:hypothetical protein